MATGNLESRNAFYLVSGASGNFGDDLIALAWIKLLRQRFPRSEIFCDVSEPSMFSWLLNRFFPELRVTVLGLFWTLSRRVPGSHWDVLRGTETELALGQDPRVRLLESILLECRSLHLLGGGYVNENWPQHFGLLSIASGMKRKTGVALRWTGASVIPMTDLQLFDISPRVADFDHISCRDARSVTALHSASSRVCEGADDYLVAKICSLFPQPELVSNEAVLLLNHQRDLFSADDYRDDIEGLRTIMQECSGQLRMMYLELNMSSDNYSLQFLREYGKDLQVLDYAGFWEMLLSGRLPFSPDSFSLASRFHLHMFLSSLGIGGRYFSNGLYYENKHTLLTEKYGSTWQPFIRRLAGRQIERHRGNPPEECWSMLQQDKLEEINRLYPV